MTRTPGMTAVADRAAEYFKPGAGFPNAGKRNAYVCEKCGRYVITIDREPGVTPFLIWCRTHGDPSCDGMMQSKMYHAAPHLEPSHEWYRPDDFADVPEGSRDHVENGGLLLRRIPGYYPKGRP